MRRSDVWLPYPRCHEPDAVLREGDLCRYCGIEVTRAASSCRSCLRWLLRPDVGGPLRDQHADGCALREDPDCYPRTEDEREAVAAGRPAM